jgi:hypothetical protein
MENPILGELVASEQTKDRLKHAEQSRLVKAALARHPAHRFELRASLGDLLISIRHLFKALARAS